MPPKVFTDLRAEAVPATLDDAGEGKLATVERDMFFHPPARAGGLAKDFAALPQAGVGARRGLQLADHVDHLRVEKELIVDQ